MALFGLHALSQVANDWYEKSPPTQIECKIYVIRDSVKHFAINKEDKNKSAQARLCAELYDMFQT